MFIKTSNGHVYETTNPSVYGDSEKLTITAGKAAIKAQAIESLHELLKHGQTVNCILRHVSASGMARRISFVIPQANGSIRNLDYLIGTACGIKLSDKTGLIVSGCGMDMGFSVVYDLGRIMWPNGTPDNKDGGYSLRSTWI